MRSRLVIFLILIEYINRAVEVFFECDECFGTLDAGYFLDFIVKNIFEVVGVATVYFYKNIVKAGGVKSFDDFGYFFQLFGYIVEKVAFVEVDAEECANVVPKFGVVNGKCSAFYNAQGPQFFHPNMYRAARDEKFFGQFGVRLFRIVHEFGEDLPVKFVDGIAHDFEKELVF